MPQTRPFVALLALTLVAALAGCASFSPGFEPPKVTVTRLRLLSGEGGVAAPKLVVGLNVANPNGTDLSARGMSYSIALEGYEVASGVTDQVPPLKAYNEASMELVLTPDVIDIMRLVRHIAREGLDRELSYELSAKLDVGAWRPAIKVHESGSVSLQSSPGAVPALP